MLLTALQLPARWNQAAAQLAYVEALLESGPRTDLVLLPEASVTGYVSPESDFDVTPFAEDLNGPTRAAYAHFAKRFDCLFVGPLIEREGTRAFNALIAVQPDGALLFRYRKKHPWYPETWATAGDAWCPTVTWRGVRVTAAICFDIHFLLQEPRVDADLVLFSSAWVDDDERDARTPLLEQLARKNQLSVLNANWGPGDVVINGQGGSVLVNSTGAPEHRHEVVRRDWPLTVTLSPRGRGE